MHVAIPTADVAEGAGVFIGEDLAVLQARVNTYLATLPGGGDTLWDADITGVGGGRLWMITLTVRDANAVPSAQNPSNCTCQLYGGENPAAILAQRVARYGAGAVGAVLYVDKLAASSNGRWFANLQITGAAVPPP